MNATTSQRTDRAKPYAAPQQQPLPLAFVPDPLRAAGLSDAHSAPLVGVRTDAGGVRSWRTSPAQAWRDVDPFPLIEWSRAANSFAALVLDCDDREAVERAHACSMGAGPLPVPNLTITRKASGHLHAAWLLRSPVHRGAEARRKPLELFGRVSEFYRSALGADAGFVGVLSSNPTDLERYETSWVRQGGYELRELARPLPRGWRMPAVATTDAGRNCVVFSAGLKFAGNPSRSDSEVEAYIHAAAAAAEVAWKDRRHVRMSDNEIHGIFVSIMHYRTQWRARGWHDPRWLARQGARGRRSGTVRAVRAMERDAAILTARVTGATVPELMRQFEVSRSTVIRAGRGGVCH